MQRELELTVVKNITGKALIFWQDLLKSGASSFTSLAFQSCLPLAHLSLERQPSKEQSVSTPAGQQLILWCFSLTLSGTLEIESDPASPSDLLRQLKLGVLLAYKWSSCKMQIVLVMMELFIVLAIPWRGVIHYSMLVYITEIISVLGSPFYRILLLLIICSRMTLTLCQEIQLMLWVFPLKSLKVSFSFAQAMRMLPIWSLVLITEENEIPEFSLEFLFLFPICVCLNTQRL